MQLKPMGANNQIRGSAPGGLTTSGGQGVQVNIATPPHSELVVLFGVKGKRRTLELAQIDVSKHKDDKIFFQDLRREYRQRRGFLRYWFSLWQLRYCDFVRVSLP